MSFRNRLTFFFVLLVILPVLAVAFVGLVAAREYEESKADVRLAQAQRAAEGVYREARVRAEEVAGTLARDAALAVAVRDDDERVIQRRLEELLRRTGGRRARLALPGGQVIEAGGGDAIAPARSQLEDAAGRRAGRLTISVTDAESYAALLARVTGLDMLLIENAQIIAGTVEGAGADRLPLRGKAEVAAREYRVAGFSTPAFERGSLAVRVLADANATESAITDSALGIGGILIAFLLCALAFALTAARSLQSQIQRLLEAAKRLGGGEFSVEVPTEGNDEFAALGRQFNDMARQLEARLEELALERSRLQETVRRVGESLGKGLDRDALLGIVVQTAVDGVGAECGRVVMCDGSSGALSEAARAGDVAAYMAAVRAAESAALSAVEAAETQLAGANALARPIEATDPEDGVLGVISIARPGRPFSARQRELFSYLAQQAALSIENVGLHEAIQRQALTDELTGLFNHRRFQEVMTAEVERTKRFDQELGLIMLDIDNFKRVNDTYGHLQGDLVLREVARVLRESSREIDEPARYGGEEMAVALPQTGLTGAYEFAERVRRRIEALELPLLEGDGKLRVTASFGAASLPHSAKVDKDALVAAADAALYRAKRSGKNRTVKAE